MTNKKTKELRKKASKNSRPPTDEEAKKFGICQDKSTGMSHDDYIKDKKETKDKE